MCAFGSCKKKVVRAVVTICLKFAVKKVVEEEVVVVLNTITSSKWKIVIWDNTTHVEMRTITHTVSRQ